jgi:hypothetical protein
MLSSHALLLRTAGAAVLSGADASEAGKNGPGMADALHSRPGAFSAGPGEFLVRGAWPCLHWFERLGQTRRSDASSTAMPGAQEAPLLRAADPLGLPGGDAPRAGRGVPLSARAHIGAGLTAILGNNSSVLFSQAYRRTCYSNKNHLLPPAWQEKAFSTLKPTDAGAKSDACKNAMLCGAADTVRLLQTVPGAFPAYRSGEIS